MSTAKPEQFGDQANWYQTLQNALVITRREVRDSFRDWRIMFPIVILTLFFPVLANVASTLFVRLFERYGADSEGLIEAFLPLMPMIVGFFPVSISLVIALETFVGEKERRSLEPLLSTPLTNTELYLGKVFAATIPPLLAGYLGMTIYLAGLILGSQQWRPAPELVLQIVVLTTVQALVMVTGAVVISSQTTSTRAANLLASTIILPVSLLVIVESLIMVKPSARYMLWYIAAGLVVVIILFVRTGARIFNREELLGRAIDKLNLKWAWRIFVDQFAGGESDYKGINVFRLYRLSVLPALGRLRSAMVVIAIIIVASFIMGWLLTDRWPLPLDGQEIDKGPYYDDQYYVLYAGQPPTDELVMENLRDLWNQGNADPGKVVSVVTINVRILIAAGIMGLFTFGVLSLLVVMLPFVILGFILGSVVASGLDPLPFIMAVVPHGVVEIPAIIIAGAAALRAGSVITKPAPRMTVGEAWLRALSDAIKIGIGVVLPMLIIAGILEVHLTPYFVERAIELGF